jgi:hypothetical protein
VAHTQSLTTNASTPLGHPLAQPRLVREAIEPTGEGPYVEAVREWIELVNLAPRRLPLHIVR